MSHDLDEEPAPGSAAAPTGRDASAPTGLTGPTGGLGATGSSSSWAAPGPEPRRAALNAAAAAARRAPIEGAAELQRYVGVLFDRKWVLLGILVILQVAAVLWTSAQPKIYETRASLLIEASVPQVLGSAVQDTVDPSPANFYMVQDFLQTSRKVLTSDSLARRAAARLRLLE